MTRIRPPRTASSSMVELNNPCVSGVHLPGWLTCEDFECDHQHPPDRGDQPDDQKGLAHQRAGAERDAHGMQDFDDHEHEQQPVDGEDQRSRVDVVLHIPPQRHRRTADPEQRGERQHQAQNQVGEHFDLQERSAGQSADPVTSLSTTSSPSMHEPLSYCPIGDAVRAAASGSLRYNRIRRSQQTSEVRCDAPHCRYEMPRIACQVKSNSAGCDKATRRANRHTAAQPLMRTIFGSESAHLPTTIRVANRKTSMPPPPSYFAWGCFRYFD